MPPDGHVAAQKRQIDADRSGAVRGQNFHESFVIDVAIVGPLASPGS
ncbi:hypothetical protein N161109_062 [Synechococcus phage S-CAM9]|uniref:Uncharacterized protein n=1 Tax=Synechococcus phage S-CAM9 TaxID=1883369 RepID=A0A1D8KPS7_9CAUD|nr:hypothetical protein BOW85_gp187 [Synechococcus phage S-CAM9]AOV60665.1 hypothetical protein N161109_062 [Synechococcus phage S-CAM9]